MATSTFDLTNSAITLLGRWEFAKLNSQRSIFCAGQNSLIYFNATGTDCSILYAVAATGTNYMQVSVDGGAFTTLTTPGLANTLTSTTVFTGLTDTSHAVILKHNAGTQANVSFQVLAGLSVTGAAPAISQHAAVGPAYRINSSIMEGFAFWEGLPYVLTSSGGYQLPKMFYTDSCLRFKGNPTTLKLFCNTALSGLVSILQDKTWLAQITLSTANSYDLVTLASGLDGATHEYEIVASQGSTTSDNVFPVQLVFVGGDIEKASLPAWRPHILYLGDSITAGGGSFNDSGRSWARLLAESKGYAPFNTAISGQLQLLGSASIATDSTESLHGGWASSNVDCSRRFPYVVLNTGHNDSADDMTELQASYQRTMTEVKGAFPNATLYAVGIFPTNAYSTTIRNNINNAMSAAATAVGGWTYISTDLLWGTGGLPPTSGQITSNTVDGIHPNAAGHSAAATLLSPNFTAYSPPAAGASLNVGIKTGSRT